MWEKMPATANNDHAYSVLRLIEGGSGMEALRLMFASGVADHMNFVLFSTGGVHGSYATIEDIETAMRSGELDDLPEDGNDTTLHQLTFLIVQPRILTIRYGLCQPQTLEDIQWLKNLRESSKRAILGIVGS